MSKISYEGKCYHSLWSYYTEDAANDQASIVRNLGYKTKVVKSEKAGLFVLYTSPKYKGERGY